MFLCLEIGIKSWDYIAGRDSRISSLKISKRGTNNFSQKPVIALKYKQGSSFPSKRIPFATIRTHFLYLCLLRNRHDPALSMTEFLGL